MNVLHLILIYSREAREKLKKWIVTVPTVRKNSILFLLGGLTEESDSE